MNLILWILFSALAGWIASLIIGHLNSRQAELLTLLSVIAGIIGGWLANLLGKGSINNFNLYSVVAAIAVAIVSIWLYGKLFLSTNK